MHCHRNSHAGESTSNGSYVVWSGSIPGGIVTTRFENGGLRVINTTTALHVFVGSITRDIGIENGQTVISTHGTGDAHMGVPRGVSLAFDAIADIRDLANQIGGPMIFNALDKSAAEYARTHFPGC